MKKIVLDSRQYCDELMEGEPVEVFTQEGTSIGLFFPMATYKAKLKDIKIPYSEEELQRRSQEKGGKTFEEIRESIFRS